MTPEVPASRRCTMPCRSWTPEVLIRKPAAARPPSTVGPCQPTVACAATPGGLSTATMSSSEYRMVMPSISTGVFSTGAGDSGSVTLSQAPPVSRSDLPAGTPSISTPPSSATAAAAVRDTPSRRARPASTRIPARPSGTGIERCVIRWVQTRDRRFSADWVSAARVSAAYAGPGYRVIFEKMCKIALNTPHPSLCFLVGTLHIVKSDFDLFPLGLRYLMCK